MDPDDYDLDMSPIPDSERRPNGAMPDELVVSLEHLRLVTTEIERALSANDRSDVVLTSEKSPDLGLALLRISETEKTAGLLADRVTSERIPDDERYPDPEDSSSPIDRVIWALRTLFRHRYSGWIPLLGKNRLVGRVHGVNGIVIHTGEHEPDMEHKPLPPRGTGPGQGVRVGVIDTGLYPNEWLAGGWAARYSDLIPSDASATTVAGHATFVTGLILSQAPGATVEVRRALNDQGEADSWTVAQEIVRLGRSGVDVLNLSFACYTDDGQAPAVLATAIDRLDPKIVVVAAAGNHADAPPEQTDGVDMRGVPAWPAALEDGIAVGAVDQAGRRAGFSPAAPWVDLYARGVEVRSTFLSQALAPGKSAPTPFGGWASWTGTSFAAALVSGAIAASTQPGRTTSKEAAADILNTLAEHDSYAVEMDSDHADLAVRGLARFLDLPAPGDIRRPTVS
jgi:membrane-anchored mycosin MYCP